MAMYRNKTNDAKRRQTPHQQRMILANRVTKPRQPSMYEKNGKKKYMATGTGAKNCLTLYI
jgi:hypothetical protein